MIPRILVVDDDAGVRFTLRELLEDAGSRWTRPPTAPMALAKHRGGRQLSPGAHRPAHAPARRARAARRLKAREPDAPRVILITAHGSERARRGGDEARRLRLLPQALRADELLAVVGGRVESVRLSAENERLEASSLLVALLVFASPAMRSWPCWSQRVAQQDVTVLITGESGTGKERVAEALVRGSAARERPFVRFNCAALTPELAEAELFGHSKGAFTGAVRRAAGSSARPTAGTLLLDEVGELDPRTQAKLLRVLQEGEVRPVGEEQLVRGRRAHPRRHPPRPRAVRARRARFREDLYYRLKVVQLACRRCASARRTSPCSPRHFLRRVQRRFGAGALRAHARAARAPRRAPLARQRARAGEHHREPGGALPARPLDPDLLPGGSPAMARAASTRTLEHRLAAYERGLMVEAIEAADGNRSEAAKLLGIGRAHALREAAQARAVGAVPTRSLQIARSRASAAASGCPALLQLGWPQHSARQGRAQVRVRPTLSSTRPAARSGLRVPGSSDRRSAHRESGLLPGAGTCSWWSRSPATTSLPSRSYSGLQALYWTRLPRRISGASRRKACVWRPTASMCARRCHGDTSPLVLPVHRPRDRRGGPFPRGLHAEGTSGSPACCYNMILLQEHRERTRQAERRAFELKHAALRAELDSLRSRTQPHFLFNVLTYTIASLVHDDADLGRADRPPARQHPGAMRSRAHALRMCRWPRSCRFVRCLPGRAAGALRQAPALRLSGRSGCRAGSPRAFLAAASGRECRRCTAWRGASTVALSACPPRSRSWGLTLRVEDDGPGPGSVPSSWQRHRAGQDLTRRLELLHGGARAATDSSGRGAGGGFSVELRIPQAKQVQT